MKNILKIILVIFEYISLYIIAYYGAKYTFVAGPIFFGYPAGVIIAALVVFLFVFHVLRKEGVIKL